LSSLIASRLIALDALLEITEGLKCQPLRLRGLLDGEATIMLHCSVNRYVFLNLVARDAFLFRLSNDDSGRSRDVRTGGRISGAGGGRQD
jgi:hypothetical protein